MTIQEIAYKRYKEEWKSEHVTPYDEHKVGNEYKEYIQDCAAMDEIPDSVDKWIDRYGYGTKSYKSFDNFLRTLYKDKEYIRSILPPDNYAEYLQTI